MYAFWWYWYVNAGHSQKLREPNAKEALKRLCSLTHLEPGSREEWPEYVLLLKPIGCGSRGYWEMKMQRRPAEIPVVWSHHRRRPTSPPRTEPVFNLNLWLHSPEKCSPRSASLPDEPHPDRLPHLSSIYGHTLLCCFKEHNLPIHCSRSFHVSIFVCIWEIRVPGTFSLSFGNSGIKSIFCNNCLALFPEGETTIDDISIRDEKWPAILFKHCLVTGIPIQLVICIDSSHMFLPQFPVSPLPSPAPLSAGSRHTDICPEAINSAANMEFHTHKSKSKSREKEMG